MAKKIGEGERNGRLTWVYDNGMERYQDTGRIAAPAPNTIITGEKSTLLHRRRQEKTAALLRQRIRETHNGVMPTQVTTSAAAFAEAGAMLYEQIALNSEAYPRDRLDTWEKLGKYAGDLPADVRQPPDQQAFAAGAAVGAGAALQFISDVLRARRGDVVEGTIHEQLHATNSGEDDG
jgi:hypothetical protein